MTGSAGFPEALKAEPPERAHDPLFLDRAIYADTGPKDTAEHHDDYLYDN